MTIQQFAIRFVCGCFLLLGLVGLFNRIVDPFWYYRDIEIKGFNAIKSQFGGLERIVKPALLIRDQPEAVILGSSYSEIGINPANPFFTNHDQLKNMNFALARASWEMVLCDFEFAVKHAHIKRALVGFHPGSLPMADCVKDFPAIGQVNTKELLLSSTALSASLKTILKQTTKNITHTREGMMFYNREDSAVAKRFREDLPYLAKFPCLTPIGNQATGNPDIKKLGEFKLEALDLSGLERMIGMAREHGVELVLYAYPRHAYSLELDRQCGRQELRWTAMKQIADLVDAKSADGSQIHAWQFYGYNDITAEPIGMTGKYWQDPAHFNFEMGDMMLRDMFGEGLPKFGRPLVSDNIDEDYQNYLQGRAEYLHRHPEFQSDLQKFLPIN